MKHLSSLVLLFALTFNGMAQNENNVWCFGDHAGLNFNSGNPISFTGAQVNTPEGCSSIADASGNLLFYTDGVTVWNKLHVQMPNGSALEGSSSTTQSALIVPMPGSGTSYYIFTVGNITGAMKYSVVDMSLSSGNGDIVASSKNTLLHPTVSEKQTSIKRCDGNIWIISHEWGTNNFFADLLTPSGLNSTVSSSIGVVHIGGGQPGYNAVGQMKISQQGNKLALAIRDMGSFSVFDFDINTGMITNPIVLTGYSTAYGIEFSPDGTKLYGGRLSPGIVYQFDLTAGSQSAIAATSIVIHSSSNLICALQLASNGKIYVANSAGQYNGVGYLDAINFPNSMSSGIGYVANGVSLSPNLSLLGLPNLMVTLQSSPAASISAIPNFININASPLLLTANPTGGTFSGNGVSGNNFNPTLAGPGTKIITYNYTTGNTTCPNSSVISTIVYDTVICSYKDTVTNYISVIDTLIIDASLTGVTPPNNINTFKVYPNPASSHIFIDNGNYNLMNGYKLKIENSIGQQVFFSLINQQQFYVDLSSWTGNGVYFIHIMDSQNNSIEIKKIVLQ